MVRRGPRFLYTQFNIYSWLLECLNSHRFDFRYSAEFRDKSLVSKDLLNTFQWLPIALKMTLECIHWAYMLNKSFCSQAPDHFSTLTLFASYLPKACLDFPQLPSFHLLRGLNALSFPTPLILLFTSYSSFSIWLQVLWGSIFYHWSYHQLEDILRAKWPDISFKLS